MAFVATKFLLARLELELEGRAIGRQLSLTDGPNLEVSRGGGKLPVPSGLLVVGFFSRKNSSPSHDLS